ncbi:MAG: hypothetical protein HY646_03140 [Acidobacteria bacterium]|nr:hypothetical protein [Acidobacteriota bacterium]
MTGIFRKFKSGNPEVNNGRFAPLQITLASVRLDELQCIEFIGLFAEFPELGYARGQLAEILPKDR